MAGNTVNTVLGILFIVFGVLLIVGEFTLEGLLPFAGLVLIVLGVLILVKTLPGGLLLGILSLVIGILLLQGFLDLPDAIQQVMRWVNIIAGVVLIVFGVQRLRA